MRFPLRAARRARATALAAAAFLGAALAVGPAAGQSDLQDVRYFRIGTSSSGGNYFAIGGIIASAISSPPGSRPCEKGGSCGVPGLIAVAQSTQGSVENVALIGRGEIESGLCQADVAYAAYEGQGRFANAPVEKLRAIASLYRETVHIVVRADSDIASVADLKGKRVAMGEEGSGTLVDADAILAAYNLRRLDVAATYQAPGPASDDLREGRIDAFFLVAGAPTRIVAELAATMPIRLVPVTAEALAKLHQSHPFFTAMAVSADTYKGVPATETVSVGADWVATADLDADLVYGVTKALWDKSTRKLLDVDGAGGTQIRLERALEGLAIPLHPGAERYYREVGVLK
jgi:TRAP transporter TAXI family solute receptor